MNLNNRKRNTLRCMNKMRQQHTYIHKFKNNCIKNDIGNDMNIILITEEMKKLLILNLNLQE